CDERDAGPAAPLFDPDPRPVAVRTPERIGELRFEAFQAGCRPFPFRAPTTAAGIGTPHPHSRPVCTAIDIYYRHRPGWRDNAIRSIEIGRHAHAIGARREPTTRTCHRSHFRRCGNVRQYRGAAGASSTRPWRPTYAMEA